MRIDPVDGKNVLFLKKSELDSLRNTIWILGTGVANQVDLGLSDDQTITIIAQLKKVLEKLMSPAPIAGKINGRSTGTG